MPKMNSQSSTDSISECITSISKLNLANTNEFSVNLVHAMAQTAEQLSKHLFSLYEHLRALDANVKCGLSSHEKETNASQLGSQDMSMLELNTTSTIEIQSANTSLASNGSNVSLSTYLFTDDEEEAREKEKVEHGFEFNASEPNETSKIEKIIMIKEAQKCRIKRLCSFRRSFLSKVFFSTD